MSSDLMLNIENTSNCQRKAMNNDIGSISIDQDGEWDISLFDELDYLGDADELLDALESAGYAGCTDLDFDMELPPWSSDASSTCTDGDVTVDSLSPSHTLSSAASPASVEAHSPYSVHEEALSPLSSQSQPSPVSVCSESSGFSEPAPERKAPKRSVPAARAKLSQLGKRPVQLSPKVSIQPRPVITAVPLAHPAAALQASTIIIQPLQTVVPLGKSPISIQPAPPTVRPVLLPQPAQVVQLQTPQTLPAGLVAVPTPAQDRRVLVPVPSPVPTPLTTPPVVPVSLQSPGSDEDSNASRRQQRMIKNRESASISRKKKKEYLLTLEARLKVALSENEKLKNENGTLKRQLEGLISENTVLSVTAPKRRAVCLMVVVVFLVFNVGTMRLFDADAGSKLAGRPVPSGRHLLGFSPERSVGESAPETGPPTAADRFEDSVSEEKALMVVKKDPLLFGAPPPCQPPINRTKCIKLAHELRGWVHRHEVERTKTRRTSNTQQRAKTIPQKTVGKNAEVAQIATVQYTESPENDRSPGSELQVYYAPHRTYSDFFEEIGRRGDTFYVVSFRRDHLLLPATNHNKGSRPKLSVVLPAMNINESIIKDKEFEVMMQIDCEVMDTRIIHIKSSSIPPFLRANQTDSETLYHPASTNSQAIPPVGVLVGAS